MARNQAYLKRKTARRKAKRLHLRRTDKNTTRTKQIRPPVKFSKARPLWELQTHRDTLVRLQDALKAKFKLELGETIRIQKEIELREARIAYLSMSPQEHFLAAFQSMNPNLQLPDAA